MTVIPQARFWLLRLLLAMITVGTMAIPALHAATFTVTTANDSGAGSLRQTVIDANANFGFDTIVIHPTLTGSTISPASPLLSLTDNIGIDGPATGSTTITSASTIFSGGAALSKQNDGTIAFTDTNTYSGGTTIDGGAFRGNTAGIQGDITNKPTAATAG